VGAPPPAPMRKKSGLARMLSPSLRRLAGASLCAATLTATLVRFYRHSHHWPKRSVWKAGCGGFNPQHSFLSTLSPLAGMVSHKAGAAASYPQHQFQKMKTSASAANLPKRLSRWLQSSLQKSWIMQPAKQSVRLHRCLTGSSAGPERKPVVCCRQNRTNITEVAADSYPFSEVKKSNGEPLYRR